MNALSLSLTNFRQNFSVAPLSSLGVPILILLIITMLVLPVHPFVLDLLFTLNILLALVVIMVAINTRGPMDFSAFPSVILVATMLRLGLNVASTRVVLLEGYKGGDAAGRVIEAFGAFVVGGNYFVGFIVFAILMIINFVVITKGAGRSAEVAARFTLDAMPGKQMAIDADLNAGVIDQEEAKIRRAQVSQESDFYGTMDGASKFVRGDAIAGILILFINLIGGIAIGMLQYDLTLDQAARAYTLLTIGDGLVAQIPALIISLATALIVARVVTAESAPEQALSQLANPAAFFITGTILILLGLIPGMPNLVFLMLGLLAISLGYLSMRKQSQTNDENFTSKSGDIAETSATENNNNEVDWEEDSQVDPINLEVGYGLISMVDDNSGGRLLNRIKSIRKKLSSELGFLLPSVRVKDNLDLEPTTYQIKLNGTIRGAGNLELSKQLAINPGNIQTELDGVRAKDPAFGMEAFWIDEGDKEHAQAVGYTVVDPGTVVATHLNSILGNNSHELMTFDVAQKLIDRVGETSPKLIEDLIPERLELGTLVQVLQNLLEEKVPLRDMRTVLETLAKESANSKDPNFLTAVVRPQLGRLILQSIVNPNDNLPVLTLDPSLEQLFTDLVSKSEDPSQIALEPNLAEDFFREIKSEANKAEEEEGVAVLIVSPSIRPWLSRMLRRVTTDLTVLAFTELPDDQKITVLASVSVDRARREEPTS